MKADIYDIEKPSWSHDMERLADAISKVHVPDFQPKSGVKIETDPNVCWDYIPFHLCFLEDTHISRIPFLQAG